MKRGEGFKIRQRHRRGYAREARGYIGWTEIQVVSGRKVVARFDTLEQATTIYPGAELDVSVTQAEAIETRIKMTMAEQTTTQPAPHVALAKPEKDAAGFSAGERIILVNGERWGRTHVDHHSRYGTSHTFEQEGGLILEEPYDPPSPIGRMSTITVRISRRRHDRDSDMRPTDVQVREKAEELVRTGKLRDPKIVKAEVDRRRAEFRQRGEERQREKDAEFKARAYAAIGEETVGAIGVAFAEQLVARIVEAMKWAQSQ